MAKQTRTSSKVVSSGRTMLRNLLRARLVRKYVAILFLVLLAVSTIGVLRTAPSASALPIAGYTIITTNYIVSHSSKLMSFIQLKEADGYSVRVVTENDYGNLVGQPPNGIAEKIRQWLKDNYRALGIKYVLLIGNPDPESGDVPMKRFWAGYDWPDQEQRDYPTDIFYANLSCNWDLDGDQIYGEVRSISSPVKPDILSDKDTFSIDWQGFVQANYSETYNIRIFHNNGVRMWLDGNLIIDDWNLDPIAHFNETTYNMVSGLHPIEIKYYKDTGDALITLEWSSPSETGGGWDFGLKRWLYHAVGQPGITGFYYENMDFTGLAGSEIDHGVNCTWCTGDRGPGGIDCHADVYVGRIPVYNKDYVQLDTILQKMINYETEQGDLSWRRKILLPTEVDDSVMQAIKTNIADPSGFTSFRLSNTPPSEAALTPQNVEDEWKKAYGVVTWFAHGAWCFAENVFSNTQCSSLDDSRPSFVCAVSCNNAWPEYSTNLAYSLLKHGAISVVAATRVSWFCWTDPKSPSWSNPSLDNEHLGYFYTKYLIQDRNTTGEALFRTKAMCPLNDWAGTDYDNACAFNLYGDPALAHAGWSVQTVDFGGVGTYTSLALDSSGKPHISYRDETRLDLKYEYWTGSGWSVQTVDSTGNVGYWTSLALDSSGKPHISYYDGTGKCLKYAYWTGSAWSTQIVDSGAGIYTSLALDSSGNPRISYYDYTNMRLKYAYWTGSAWSVQIVDSTGKVGQDTSLALDSSGKPHISYYDYTNGDLKYAYWTGSAWSIQTVDSTGDVGVCTSLALDSTGKPHISYYDYTNKLLKHAFWTGSGWSIQYVDLGFGMTTSLALDSSGNPRISYYDNINKDLKYAYWTGSAWAIQTVDSTGDVGEYSSLALDSMNNPSISYYDATNGALKYAVPGGVPLPAPTACLAVRGLDNGIWYRACNYASGTWGPWNKLPGATCDSPAAAVCNNKLYIVVRGMDGSSLWYGYVDLGTSSFSGWIGLSGSTPSAPTLTSNGALLCLVVRGMDNRVYYKCSSCCGSWGSWQVVPTGATLDTPAAAMLGNDLHIVVRKMDGCSLWDIIVRCDGTVVRGWRLVSGATLSRPVLASVQSSGKLCLVVRGLDNRIWYRDHTASTDSWGSWSSLPGSTIDGPGATECGNKLHIVVRGSDGNSLWFWNSNNWTKISGATHSAPTLTS